MFFEWFLFGFPVAMILLVLLFLYLTRVQFKVEHKGEMSVAFIQKGLEDLGKMKREEKWVFVVFLMTAFLWIFKLFLFGGMTVSDTSIAIFGLNAVISHSATNGENIRMAGYERTAVGTFAFVWRRAFARYGLCRNQFNRMDRRKFTAFKRAFLYHAVDYFNGSDSVYD